MFSVHNTQVLHITGCSRPPGEVGLTPRQYTEWNVVVRARATGGSSQQGLLPKVYRTACTRWYAHQSVQINNEPTTKNPRSCARVVYIAGDTLCHQPMGASHMTMLQLCGPIGSCVLPWWLFIAVDTLCQHPIGMGHMTVLQLRGLMEFRVLQWCHPMLASTRRTSCCTRIITLYGTLKWIQARTETILSMDGLSFYSG